MFQHGLGGDLEQPLSLLRPPEGWQVLAFDCRGHGLTRPLGDERQLAIGQFADDLAGMLDHLGIARAVIGGISMGAAVALNFAIRYPSRSNGLVLSRPAWLAGPNPRNLELFGLVARLIRERGTVDGLAAFRQSNDYRTLAVKSPDCARSLELHFQSPRAEDAVARLERIPVDSPCRSLDDVRRIATPTLVLGNRRDPIHPFEFGEALAEAIPGATFREVTSKSESVEGHGEDVRAAIESFLRALPSVSRR